MITQNVILQNGSTIIMPPWFRGELGWGNMALPNVYETDDAIQAYPAGTKFVEGDRTWFYARFRGTVTTPYTSYTQESGTDLQGIQLFTGAYQVDMTNAKLVRKIQDEQSLWYQTTPSAGRADDFYAGGFVVGKDTVTNHRPFFRRIIAQNYDATGLARSLSWNAVNQEYTEVDLSSYSQVSELQCDQPFHQSKTSLPTMIMPLPYKNAAAFRVDANSHADGMAIGACMTNNPTYDHWVWCQTHGQLGTIAIVNANVGGENNEILYYVMGDGGYQGVVSGEDTTYDLTERQLAGVSYGSTRFETGSYQDEGVPIIFLTMRR